MLPDAPVSNLHEFAHAGYFIERHSFDAVISEAILNVDIAPGHWEVITLEDVTYASANVIRKQTKRSSKWLPEELHMQVLVAVTRIEGVEWSALKPCGSEIAILYPMRPMGWVSVGPLGSEPYGSTLDEGLPPSLYSPGQCSSRVCFASQSGFTSGWAT